MLSKAHIRLIRSLDTRKGRRTHRLFVAEGPKLVGELAGHFRCVYIAATEAWATAQVALFRAAAEADIVTPAELERASLQQTPQEVIALFQQPTYDTNPVTAMTTGLHIVLDNVQDPGNLGTIVRLADWFGVHDVWCSLATADIWNPKAVQATMGALARVRVHYINIAAVMAALPPTTPRYATALDGEPLWQAVLTSAGIIVMGNEGRGISDEVRRACNRRLLIPNFPASATAVESLNVGVATAIVLAEFRRRESNGS